MDIKSFYYRYDYSDQSDVERDFEKAFREAGFQTIKMEQDDPALYGGDIPAWFSIKTEFGEFIVGWTHHGIALDWSGSPEANKKTREILEKLKDEKRQKDVFAISAAGCDKLKEYLSVIRTIISDRT